MPFPDGFWWGTAASATQAEGASPTSDWALWEQRGRVPRSAEGNGFARHAADDLALLAERGLRHHRLSIDWSRVEPAPGRIDAGEVERYRRILSTARDLGVSVWVCLHHFTLPGWFADEGGFLDDRARSRHWPRWVDTAAQAFGDLVAGWKPINEPVAWAAGSYLTGALPPGERDPGKFADALAAIHLAWRDAWRQLRGGGPPVCTVWNLSPVHATEPTPAGRRAAARVDDVIWGLAVRAIRDGVLAVPDRAEVEVQDLAGSCDLVGFSYYSALGVRPDASTAPWPPGARVGPLGYAPWPRGLGEVLHRLAEELPDRPLVVAELGVGTSDDSWRTDVLRASLAEVEQACVDGVDVRGVFFWTGIDNYEWRHGFSVPFGLFDRARVARPSATMVAEVIRAGTTDVGA